MLKRLARPSDRAGIEDLTFHDLRGTAVVRLVVAGATATFTGHSLKDVEAILDTHDQERDIELAEAAVLKLEARKNRKRPPLRGVPNLSSY